MGVIVSSTTDRDGHTTRTEVRVNRLQEFVIESARLFGRNRQWRVIHWIERRKLNRR